MLRRQVTSFAQRASVSWWTGGADSAPPNDLRQVEITTTVVDTNQVSKLTFGYDDYNNQNNVKEYDFGAGAEGALLRETRTKFVTDAGYTGTNVHLRSLPTQISVYDGGGVERARTTYEYDNYSTATHHGPLVSRSTVSGFDSTFSSSYTTRGNVTGVTSYLLTNETVTGSISSYAQFDILGNTVKGIDAKEYATDFSYGDSYGSPNGNARLNSQPIELSAAGQVSYAFVTRVTNALGQTTYTQFDYYTGRAVDAEDLNGVVSSAYSDSEPLDRPTKVIRAVNTSAQNRIVFTYDDSNRIVTTASDLNSNTDGLLVSKVVDDGLGRTTETRQYEGGSNYIAVQTQYDALGRAFKTSNPFRPWQSESAVWTTTAFDAQGRVITVTTPDSAVVSTSYCGNTVTVTDQAGKQRKSETDALGRLKHVYEDPNGLNYLTSYTYDVLDNLIAVTQGTQTPRTFTYDSLKRLKSAANPESGTINYTYDNNGNLLTKIDARSITTTYAYDSLNRSTTVDYSNTTINPDITRNYDGATEGIGRLWESYAGGTEATGSNVEHTKIHEYDALGRPMEQRQRFKTNSVWSSVEFKTERTYDASTVTSQTYPSGHIVNFGYDAAGRLTSFTGDLGDGVQQRNYATNISYNSAGQWTREHFGTQTPLYNKRFFNSRQQLYGMFLSTVNDDSDWNRGAIVNYYSLSNYGFGNVGADTNGNLYVQQHWVPDNDAVSSHSFMQQNYDYDSLNRLKWMAEYQNGATETGSQNFAYDRWGNRTISFAYGTGINNKSFTVNPSNNRLTVPSGQSEIMSYDDAGNLTADTYSGSATTRAYDAENRMISETQGGSVPAATYTYNADGQRVRRKVDGAETWQVYGMEGELLAEYAATASAPSLQKEYGYRNGELLVTADAPPPPTINGYTYQRTLTIDHNKVPNTDQNNFPVLISGTYSYLATVANGGNVQNANGYDVVLTSDAGCVTKLNHEVESYNATTGAVNYWVQVPTVFHSSDTSIYMCYGNSTITTDQSNKTGVWDANFKGAWHLPNGSSLSANDSTSHANNGTTSGAVAAAAKIDGGGNFNGSSDYVDVKAGKVDDSATTGTVSAWVKISVLDTNGAVLGYGGSAGSAPAVWGVYTRLVSGNRYFAVAGRATEGAPYNTVRGSTVLAANTWYYVAYSSNGSTWKIRLNGAAAQTLTAVLGTNTGQWIGDITPTSPDKSVMGGVYAGGGYSSVNFWHGLLDEVRVSNIERSDDWVTTEYNNQSSPGTFYTVSAATSGSTSSADIRWLVTDHLGTPRIIADETGSLAGIKRHDYLPFGEELLAGSGGRTITKGYSGDEVRQKFTQKERDNETGLDYFLARYYSSVQGRFTSFDPGAFVPADPQNWNRYSYVQNNPLKFIDPNGKDLFLTGDDADYLVSELEKQTGYKLKRNTKTGRVTIDTSVKRNTKGTSTWLANKVNQITGDSQAWVQIKTGRNQAGIAGDSFNKREIDVADYDEFKKADPKFAARFMGHVLEEYYYAAKMPSPFSDQGRFPESHEAALEFESDVLSDFTGWWEKPREQKTVSERPGEVTLRFDYSTVAYDVLYKSGAAGDVQVGKVTKIERRKPRAQ